MAINLTGTWTNSNGLDGDIVHIYHCKTAIFIHGFNSKDNQNYENFGFAAVPEGLDIGGKFEVTWTDTYNSNGREKGIAHHTEIEIKAADILKKTGDEVITATYEDSSHITSFGNWTRIDQSFISQIPNK